MNNELQAFFSLNSKNAVAAPATVFIYGLNDPVTGKCRYVGKAVDPHRRFGKHLLRAGESSTHKNCWIRGLTAKGLQPVLEVLDEVPAAEWKFWEQEYIRVFRMIGMNLTNLTDGGDGTVGLTDESRQKISAAAKKRTWSPAMREKMARRTCSPETRNKLSVAGIGRTPWNRGKPASEQSRQKQSIMLRGRKLSEEHKKKIALAHVGLRPTEETREKLRNRITTEATRAKISASKVGKKLGPRK